MELDLYQLVSLFEFIEDVERQQVERHLMATYMGSQYQLKDSLPKFKSWLNG